MLFLTLHDFYFLFLLIYSADLFLQNQHMAASQGKENCVLLLLDYGADPNIRGIYFLPLP